MAEKEIKEATVEYTSEFKAELDRRHAAYNDGTEKIVTADESKKRIGKLLKSVKK